jgi:energy-converting hydrogenase B subunit C
LLEYTGIPDIIRSIIIIIAAILIVVSAIGILRVKDEMDKVIYARIHMLGMMDIASVLALIGLNQPLLAVICFILAPFLAHAMANAYYHGEDERQYENTFEDNKFTGKLEEDKA